MRVAARRRHLQRVEHGGLGRPLEVGHVGVPDRLAGAEAADRLTVRAEHVGDDGDLRLALHEAAAVLLRRRPTEVAAAAAEGDQVVVGQRLAAEQQHGMREPGPVDGVELRVRDTVSG
jgi:hypothetical protein